MRKVAYRKVYRIRVQGRGGYVAYLPRVVLEAAARSKGIAIEEFVKTHQVAYLFNNFDDFDCAIRLEPIEEPNQVVIEVSEEELAELGPHEKEVSAREPSPKRQSFSSFNELRAKLKGGTQ